tara:strand:+ start:77 stop:757 length:681 start_codon:yes stop_codon:yes gene_type:complete
MNHKSKYALTALLCVLLTNTSSGEEATSSINGNVGSKYTSDYHRRGQAVSQEAIQAQIGFNTGIGSVGIFGDFFTSQGISDTGSADSNEITVGGTYELMEDKINLYAGLYNTDSSVSENDLEAFTSIGFGVPLSPVVSVFRDTDDNLYTWEGQISYDVDLDIMSVGITGILGNTDLTESTDSTYYGTVLTVTKNINTVNLYTDLTLSDNGDRESETIWGAGLSVKF